MFVRHKKRSDNPALAKPARVVALYIKSTNITGAKGGSVEAGDKLTQIACLEFIEGKRTHKDFCSFVKITDAEIERRCLAGYRGHDDFSEKEMQDICGNQIHAPEFKDIQAQLMEFLMAENTVVVVHFKKRVLDFLRVNLDEPNRELLNKRHKELMCDVQIGGKKLYMAGEYHAGKYPVMLKNNNDGLQQDQKVRFNFDAWCEENGITTRRKTTYDAMTDADRMGRAYINQQGKINELDARKDEGQGAKKNRGKK